MQCVLGYDSFFEEDLYDKCLKFSNDNLPNNSYNTMNKQDYRINLLHWDSNVVKDSNPVYILDENLKGKSEIFVEIKEFFEKKTGINKRNIESILFNYWTQGSHIPWHNDGDNSGGMTIYLNTNWDIDHGGLFLYKNKGAINAVVPKRNSAILQIGGIPHSVCPTTKNSNIRQTIQIFLKQDESVFTSLKLPV